MYKEHHHYYGAFFAILEAERSLGSARPPPFVPLGKSRRVPAKSSAAIKMAQLEQDGFDFENLKKEIDSAFRRRKKDECTFKLIFPRTHRNILRTLAFIQGFETYTPFLSTISDVTILLFLCLTILSHSKPQGGQRRQASRRRRRSEASSYGRSDGMSVLLR